MGEAERGPLDQEILASRVEKRMSVSKEDQLPIASAWQLEFTRLIAFPANPPFFIDQHWWQDLTSEQPPDFLSTQKKDIRDDRGSFRGALLSLTVDLNRIIWEARSLSVVGPDGYFPTLGPFREKLHWFGELLSPWLTNSCPPLFRLALSAKMLRAAATAQEAYRVLKSYLPGVNILDSNPSDFLLQINRRKETSGVVAGLPINRVCTWSKMNMAIFLEPGKPFRWPDSCYSALELDINTAPEKADLLPRATLARLFSELASLGGEIAEHGDTP
jgi:hypothetical protein